MSFSQSVQGREVRENLSCASFPHWGMFASLAFIPWVFWSDILANKPAAGVWRWGAWSLGAQREMLWAVRRRRCWHPLELDAAGTAGAEPVAQGPKEGGWAMRDG